MNAEFEIREMDDCDVPEVVPLLLEGFPRRTADYWREGLKRLAERERPPHTEKYGYVLAAGNSLRGVVLTIPSIHNSVSGPQVFINISSWYVRPSHRGQPAKELYYHASRRDGITYTNLSAATNTIKTITSFGFREWTAGQMIAVGLKRRRSIGKRLQFLTPDQAKSAGISEAEARVLVDHAAFGCLAFCLETADRLSPFIFMPRQVKHTLSCAQLIYCQSLDDLVAHGRAILFWLAAHGLPLMILDASGPIKGLIGRFIPGKAIKYVKGPTPTKVIDHTYSEMVVLGV